MKNEETCNKWYQKIWRPAAAYVYLFIVLFDFVIMPVVFSTNAPGITDTISTINELDSEEAQVAAVQQTTLSQPTWQPLTIQGGAIFHLAFGAILTGCAVTRGLEKRELLKKA